MRQAARSRKVLNAKPSSPVPVPAAAKGNTRGAAAGLDDDNDAQGAAKKPAVPRKRLAALAQQDRQKQNRKRKATAAADADADNVGGDESGGYGSAVSAPDWPPVKSASALPNGKPATKPAKKGASTATAGQSGGRKSDQATVRDFLRAGNKPTLGLDTWEDADDGEKRQHDRLLSRSTPGRKKNDDYDEEYDRGKTKKVKGNASERGGGRLDSASFDKAYKTQQENGRPEVQLRGKKKKAAEMAERQYGQGQRQERGRGRGGQRGGRGRGRGGGRHR
jgi:hypothetical protein